MTGTSLSSMKRAGVGADEELVFGEEGVEVDEVYALKLECHSLAILDEWGRTAWAITRRGVARGRRYGSGLQPLGLLWAVTWGFAPGCDVGGPSALRRSAGPPALCWLADALLALRRSVGPPALRWPSGAPSALRRSAGPPALRWPSGALLALRRSAGPPALRWPSGALLALRRSAGPPALCWFAIGAVRTLTDPVVRAAYQT